MKLKSKITILILILFAILAGLYFYQGWKSETFWGIFFVTLFVVVPAWIVLALKLWTRCPRCRRFGTIQVIAAELRKKGVDPNLPLEDPEDEDDSSLDAILDLYDLFCRYRCKHCGFEWEEKPPPSYRCASPPPPA